MEYSSRDHRIDLEDRKIPSFGPIYLLVEKELEVLREYLEANTVNEWIRSSTSPTRAPIFFIPKKGGKLYLYIDYYSLNAITKKD